MKGITGKPALEAYQRVAVDAGEPDHPAVEVGAGWW